VKVSVVIPTLNEERFIAECIRSIRAQGVPCEIIVVDGGSSDRTVDVACEVADVVLSVNVRGVGVQRDAGSRYAHGDVIVSADADNVYAEGWLRSLLENFENPSVVAVGGRCVPREPSPMANMFAGALNAFSKNLKLFPGGNMAFRKDAFLKVGGYSYIMKAEDWSLCTRLASAGKLVYEPRAVAYIDVPVNRKAEMASFPVAAGLALTGDPMAAGMSAGFVAAELVTSVVEEPSPIHHSHIGLAGLAASTAVKGRVPEPVRKGAGGVFSGITWHHVVTEDVLKPASFASVTPLWLGLTALLALT